MAEGGAGIDALGPGGQIVCVIRDGEAIIGYVVIDSTVVGRSRGGLSTKVHQLVDSRGLPLVVLLGPGQIRLEFVTVIVQPHGGGLQ